jgi:hypothetical protein
MTLEQALQWAEKNCTPETVGRLRSRDVVATLADEVRRTRAALKEIAQLEAYYGGETPRNVALARSALGCKRHNSALRGDSGFIAGVQLESTVMQRND